MKLNVFAVGVFWLLLMAPFVTARVQVCVARVSSVSPAGARRARGPSSPRDMNDADERSRTVA